MPSLFSTVNTVDPSTLFGLSYRTVAYESLLFVDEALQTLKRTKILAGKSFFL